MEANKLNIEFTNLPKDCDDFDELSHALEGYFQEIIQYNEMPEIKVKFRHGGNQIPPLYAVATFNSLSGM